MRVERLRDEFEVEFDVCAYELRPGLPPEGMSREQAYAGRSYPAGYIENLLQIAQDCGIEMKRTARIPNTHLAHQATEFAREHGKLIEFHRAVFRAYWEEERDIGRAGVLCGVASARGLDADELGRALEDGRYAARVQEQMEWSRQAGVTGVPTTVFSGKFAVVGAQDYAVFRDVAARIASGRLKAEG